MGNDTKSSREGTNHLFPARYTANLLQRRTGPPSMPSATGPSHTAPPKATVPAKRPLQKEQPTPSEESKEEKKDEGKKSQDEDSQPSQPKDRPSSAKSTERTAPKKDKNNLFSSFAKAKPKQKKEGSATPAASGAESVSLRLYFCKSEVLTID